MIDSKKHYTKKWEISIIELQNEIGKKYKVTRKLPEISVSETRIYRSKKYAIRQFEKWLE